MDFETEKTYHTDAFTRRMEETNAAYERVLAILHAGISVTWTDSNCLILNSASLKQSGEYRKVLRALWPDIRFKFNKWSPYVDTVILCWSSDKYNIDVWVHTTVADDPTKNTKCKFKRVESESFALVCDTEAANE